MKKALITIAAVLAVLVLSVGLTGCLNIQLGGGNGLSVTGNGQLGTKDIPLTGAVKGARTETSINIVLDAALEGKAVLEGEANILELVTVNQTAGVVTVNYKPNTMIFCTRPVTLRVPLVQGGLLETTSSGSVSIAGSDVLKGDAFELRTNSSGSITVRLETKDLRATSTSSGNINVMGSADKADIDLSSSGSFEGFDCKMQSAHVTLSSSGSAQVNVAASLTGNISSSGNIVYEGDPANVNVSDSSSGKAFHR